MSILIVKNELMKVALILPAEPEMAPYIHYYINVLKKECVNYNLIAWNRSGKNSRITSNMIMYDSVSPDTASYIEKMRGYIGFTRFVKKQLKSVEYDLVVIHTILPAVLMKRFLIRNYEKRYVLDIRDRGSLFGLWKHQFSKLLSSSVFNVISSPGFKQWLPKSNFYLSHNIGLNGLKGVCLDKEIQFGGKITILSIGQIRFYEANKYVIDSLANNSRFGLHYAGFGPDSERLQLYCSQNHISNVIFSGRYMKKDEPEILGSCDFINIVFPKTSGTLSAMPNRFYGATIFRKPVIVTSGSVQAEYVKKYGTGIILDENVELQKQIENYIASFDSERFVMGCDAFLSEVAKDNECFENQLIGVIRKL